MSSPAAPTVLAVLVVRDAAPWLRRSLAAVGRQTYQRLGVLAVDAGSRDGSGEILERSLGKRRVIRVDRDVGFPGSVRRALSVPAVREADFVLLMHDDVALAPDAVERLLEAAARFERAGIVGAKVVDWERPEVLREVGFACDRFGHPYSPLEEGEIDHGQYDVPREVMFVSSAAMLVAKELWTRVGVPDERLKPAHADLDLCWRARVAGYRVVVTPDAVAYHRGAGERGERLDPDPSDSRYFDERAGLASTLKSYRAVTLLWVLPFYVGASIGRIVGSLVSRHLEDAGALLRAWGWNIIRLPGTIRRRARAQAVRAVRDHEVARFMTAPGARLRRLALQASALVARRGSATLDEEDLADPEPLRRRAAAFVTRHPAGAALVAAVLIVLVGFREVLFAPEIQGGALPVFPKGASSFFAELASPWRSTGFGGAGGASPALFVLGVGSTITLGDPTLFARLFVALGPLLAGVSCYRAARRITGERHGATLGAVAYALSGLVLWASSDGRVAVLVLLIAIPWLVVRFGLAFDGRQGRAAFRWIVGTAAVLAVVCSFFPAVWIAALTGILPILLSARSPGRGLALTLGAFGAAAVLVFPFTRELLGASGGSSVEAVGTADPWELMRLAPAASAGTSVAALFLPVAGLLAFSIARNDDGWGSRMLATAALGVGLAWLAATGRLPDLLRNPVAFLSASAFAFSLLVALGVAAAASALRRAAFGAAQLVVGALAVVVGAGLLLQAGHLAFGRLEVGEHREPPAWPVVSRAAGGTPFRVLWLGAADGDRLPAPGGQPTGVVEAGADSIAYAVTGREGRSALDTGLPLQSEGDAAVESALLSMLSGEVRHGGSLLGLAAIRFIVAGEGTLPERVASVVEAQVDVDLVQRAGGLAIWRNDNALPIAVALSGPEAVAAAEAGDPVGAAALDRSQASELSATDAGWRGSLGAVQDGVVLVSTEFDPRWRLVDASGAGPFRAFGWETGFALQASESDRVEVVFDAGPQRLLELVGMGLLWAGVLWVVGRRPRVAARHARVERVEAPALRPPASPHSGGPRTERVPEER